MTTRAHEVTRDVARQWEALYPSAVCSGIAPDKRHLSQGGYHVSIEDNPKGNYSTRRPDDKAAKEKDLSAAIDMSMSRADMIRCTKRLKRVYDNPDDPRRKYLNAFNGWLGSGDARRYDIWARVDSWASPDHTWHIHAEFRRRFVTSRDAARAFISAVSGQSIADYEASLRPRPAPAKTAPAKDVDDMTVDELLDHKIPFEYTDTNGKKVSTHLTLRTALLRGWTHDYDVRNKTLPAQAKATAALAGQVSGLTALVKILLADDTSRVDGAQFDQLLAHITAAARDGADQVVRALTSTQTGAEPAPPGEA